MIRNAMLSVWLVLSAAVWGQVPGDVNTGDVVANKNSVLVVGATRGVGLELVKQLVARGDHVTAFVRPSSDITALEPLGVRFVKGDALNRADLDAAFAAGPYRAVVTTLGCFKCEMPPDYEGNKNVFEAAHDVGSRRVLMVSTMGTGDTWDAVPFPAKIMLKDIIALKDKAEKVLMSLDLDYTILRPGALTSKPATGTGIMLEQTDSAGVINRADVAALLVQCIDDDKTIGKAYAVVDKNLSWPWDMIF